MENRVEKLLGKLEQLEEELGNPALMQDRKRYLELTREHSQITDIKNVWDELQKSKRQLQDNKELLEMENDPAFIKDLAIDSKEIEAKVAKLESKLKNLLIPPDPNDHRNTIIELRAGTGGDEAALFVGDCVRMYKLFADHMGWKYEELASTESEVGGYKENFMVFSGPNVNRFLRYEGGTHRVQRVPETEAQGRVHTSAITCAVMLEPDEESNVQVDEKDLRIDTYRSSGAGGQHVNTTDSAVRITHIPTGIVAYCQEERSQHKNKDKALRLLKAKIAEEEQRKADQARSDFRSQQVGSGDRSERIRTYNFSQNRITDHRIGLTLYNLDRVMNGDLEAVCQALISHFHE